SGGLTQARSPAMPRHSKDTVAVLGIGKNTFHLVGLNKRGAIVLRQRCGGHRRSRPAAYHALRRHQDGGTTRSTSLAPGALPSHRRTHGDCQRDPRLPPRPRHRHRSRLASAASGAPRHSRHTHRRANKIACALTSMMARSPISSTQRPDTLRQNQIPHRFLLQRTAGPYMWVNFPPVLARTSYGECYTVL